MIELKIKAVIMRPDRTNDVVVKKPGDIENGIFRFRKHLYIVDPDRVQITMNQPLGRGPAIHYSTYYYIEGVSNPLPVPHFDGKLENYLPDGVDKDAIVIAEFPEVIDNGISSEELAAIFNPWFYQIIGKIEDPWYKQVQFWLVAGIAVACAYIVFVISNMQGDLDEIRGIVNGLRSSVRGVMP